MSCLRRAEFRFMGLTFTKQNAKGTNPQKLMFCISAFHSEITGNSKKPYVNISSSSHPKRLSFTVQLSQKPRRKSSIYAVNQSLLTVLFAGFINAWVLICSGTRNIGRAKKNLNSSFKKCVRRK